jgi:phosphohistidine phosphatase
MLTLSILRHAKSAWDDPELPDSERPLAPRGRKTAPLMGAFMAAQGLSPNIVLCSPAQRTRETFDLVGPYLGGKPKISLDDGLYLVDGDQLLARLRAIKPVARRIPRHALLVGHNPGLQELALDLMARDPAHAGDRRALSEKLPTAGLVVLDFEAERWRELTPGTGRLRHFMTPKRLQAA